MFDIHKIKPVHGWREFIGEVGIIVLGVLIALLAEGMIESWRWHEQMEQTREAIKADLLSASINALERLAINPCERTDIKLLYQKLTSENDEFDGHPLYTWKSDTSYPVIPYVYSAPNRPYSFDSWKNAVAGGVFNHLNSTERQVYARLGISIDYLQRAQEQEGSGADRLAPLSAQIKLDRQTKSGLIASLAFVDKQNRDTTLFASYLLDEVHQLHFGFDKSNVDAAVKDMFKGERSHRGPCVRDLRLNLE